MLDLTYFEQYNLWSNSGADYVTALIIFVGALIILKLFQVVVLHKLRALAKKTDTDIDDLVIGMFGRFKPPFYIAVSAYLGLQKLTLSGLVDGLINGLIVLVVVYYVVYVAQELINYGTQKIISNKNDGEEADPTAVRTINSLLKMVLWVVAGIMILSNWGVNVSSLIAGLGVGGIALAFAFQNILEDVFSSFSILIDKPFKVGDFVQVGGDFGTIEKVGIKTTRIRTPQGEELVMSNRELTSARINNFGKLERRRNLFTVGATYETPSDKLRKVPSLIEEAVKGVEGVTFDRVHFKNFGDSSLDFEIVYYAETNDYARYMDLQHEVKFSIKEAFDKESIEFAYPTVTQYNKN